MAGRKPAAADVICVTARGDLTLEIMANSGFGGHRRYERD
jgi:hypothetical protein